MAAYTLYIRGRRWGDYRSKESAKREKANLVSRRLCKYKEAKICKGREVKGGDQNGLTTLRN